MKFFLILPLFILSAWAETPAPAAPLTHADFVDTPALELSRDDQAIGARLVAMIKLVDSGYVNKDVLTKVTKEIEKSKNFQPFVTLVSTSLFT